jgi:peptidylprolyl isomerase
MAKAKTGDTVKVHYTVKMKDGTVCGSSADRDPLQFTIGKGQTLLAMEQAVVGMSPGQSKTIDIPSDQAFGPHRKELVAVIKRDQFPEGVKPELGQQLELKQSQGSDTVVVTITDVSESTVTLDANHPLAGKDLIFEIKLVEIA